MPRLICTHHIFILNFYIFFCLGVILSTSYSFATMKATTMKLRGCIFFASTSFTFNNFVSKIQIIIFGSSQLAKLLRWLNTISDTSVAFTISLKPSILWSPKMAASKLTTLIITPSYVPLPWQHD